MKRAKVFLLKTRWQQYSRCIFPWRHPQCHDFSVSPNHPWDKRNLFSWHDKICWINDIHGFFSCLRHFFLWSAYHAVFQVNLCQRHLSREGSLRHLRLDRKLQVFFSYRLIKLFVFLAHHRLLDRNERLCWQLCPSTRHVSWHSG